MVDNVSETRLDYPYLHEVVFEFHARFLAGQLSWKTVKDYETDCRDLPTSWLLEMQIPKVSITGDVSISVTLKRNDTMNKPVSANISIKFTDTNDKYLLDGLTSFGKRNVMPGEEIRESIVGHIRPEERRLFNEDLRVTVTIIIRLCHLDDIMKSLTSVSTDGDPKLSSMI